MPIAKFPPRHRRAIETWLRRRGYSLSYGRGVRKDEVDFDARRVSVSCQAQPTIGALHECGHVLVSLARRRRPQSLIAGSTLRQFQANSCVAETARLRRLADGLRVVAEELVAWERGFQLGRRLHLRVSAKTYQRHVLRNAMSYVRWLAMTPPG